MVSIVATFSDYWNLLGSVDAAQIKGIAANNMGLALLVCFFSGILTSLTPCVYPMIPITINIFGRMAQQSSVKGSWGFNPYSFRMSCIYVGGMSSTYSLMGILSGLTGSVFGTVLQSGWMLGFLCVLFLTLSLAQFGLFKIQLPIALQSRLAGTGNTQNTLGVFLMGLISGLIVSPCVGPVIAGILAFVFDSSNAWTGFLYFLSFSLGLGVLFLLIGAFSGLVNRIPRSGKWMMRVNWLLASLLLGASSYYGVLFAKRLGVGTTIQDSTLQWAQSIPSSHTVPVVIDFTADWCETCHVIEQTVFNNPEVLEKLKGFNLVRVDMTSFTSENEALAKRFEVFGLPAIVFLDVDGKTLPQRVTGVLTAKEFLALLPVSK